MTEPSADKDNLSRDEGWKRYKDAFTKPEICFVLDSGLFYARGGCSLSS